MVERKPRIDLAILAMDSKGNPRCRWLWAPTDNCHDMISLGYGPTPKQHSHVRECVRVNEPHFGAKRNMVLWKVEVIGDLSGGQRGEAERSTNDTV